MRALSVLAVSTMLVALAAASIGMTNPPSSAVPAPPQPASSTDVIGLMRQLAEALMREDRVAVANLVDDNATIYDNNFNCGQTVSKKDWINSALMPYAGARLIDILDHTVSSGLGVAHYQQAALMNASDPFANSTFNAYHNVLAAMPNAKGDKFLFIRNINGGANPQTNTSLLMQAFYVWANASTLADVGVMAGMLNDTATELVYPPHATQPFSADRSAILAELAHAKETRAFLDIDYVFAIPSCSSVATLVTTFDAQKDGRRFVNKAFVGVHFTADGFVYLVESFPLFWRGQ